MAVLNGCLVDGVALRRDSAGLSDHPVYLALPPEVRALLAETACRHDMETEEAPPEGALFFLLKGVLGFFPPLGRVCVGVVAPGSVLGWETALGGARASEVRALLPCQGYAAPLAPVMEHLGEAWTYRFLAMRAVARARVLGVEAACNARHSAVQRVAKWIVRLQKATNDRHGVQITQGRLADLLGLQRTSVNAACHKLQDIGALRLRRGRMIVENPGLLGRSSCSCDLNLADGAVERRRDRHLN
ncbi:Crp/Fnr family transcriptional regulator [Brevundimonas faecalis]|uniref:CRP-like cAMP-binding protein n=1 Tax=Brevundimonas faecalis TaxID=947378 RepID=A0ABV2R7X8_9CAUL